jgi:hypothetical protein
MRKVRASVRFFHFWLEIHKKSRQVKAALKIVK